MGAARPIETLSSAEAVRALGRPGALERFSCLTGAPLLVIDFSDASSSASRAPTITPSVKRALRTLPCPIAALGDARALAAPSLAAEIDVQACNESELGLIVGAAQRTPLAAAALVQLLRVGERLDLHSALVCESLAYATLQAGPEHARWLAERAQNPVSQSHPATDPPASDGEPAVIASRSGNVLELELNRPHVHNAFSSAMRDALVEALALADADEEIARVVLRGRGPSFCSGGDLGEFGTLPDPATAHQVRATRNPGRLLTSLGTRVRVEVHGACVGAGVELPSFCAHVRATRDAYFELPELAMGLVPGAGGTASIARRIGRQRFAFMALTGMRVDPATALAWGLVDEVAVD